MTDRLTTIMTRTGNYQYTKYTCAECSTSHSADARRWKFCPHCGAEIIRFDEPAQEPVVHVVAHMEKTEPTVTKVSVRKAEK